MLKIIEFSKNKIRILDNLDAIKGKVWIDVTNITKEEAQPLQDKFNLHILTIDDLVHARTRIKVEQFPNYLFCVFYALRKDKSIKPDEIDFVVGKSFLITNHVNHSQVIEQLQQNTEFLTKLFSRGIDFVFYRILHSQVDTFFPVLSTMDGEIERVEREITEHPSPELLRHVMQLKKSVVSVKKIVLPQREKIADLAKNEYPFISKKAVPYFRDIHDHSVRVYEAIENYRESVSSVYELYMSAVSNNMNEVIKVLSIIATSALPLTVISGIYGTNFSWLPGATSPYGFWIMIMLMILVMIVLILFFKRKRWL